MELSAWFFWLNNQLEMGVLNWIHFQTSKPFLVSGSLYSNAFQTLCNIWHSSIGVFSSLKGSAQNRN